MAQPEGLAQWTHILVSTRFLIEHLGGQPGIFGAQQEAYNVRAGQLEGRQAT